MGIEEGGGGGVDAGGTGTRDCHSTVALHAAPGLTPDGEGGGDGEGAPADRNLLEVRWRPACASSPAPTHPAPRSRAAPPAPDGRPPQPRGSSPPCRVRRVGVAEPHRPRHIVEDLARRPAATCRRRRRLQSGRRVARAQGLGASDGAHPQREPRGGLAAALAAEPRLGSQAVGHRPVAPAAGNGRRGGRPGGAILQPCPGGRLPTGLPAEPRLGTQTPGHRPAAPRARRALARSRSSAQQIAGLLQQPRRPGLKPVGLMVPGGVGEQLADALLDHLRPLVRPAPPLRRHTPLRRPVGEALAQPRAGAIELMAGARRQPDRPASGISATRRVRPSGRRFRIGDWSRRSRRGPQIALQAAEARSAPKPGWEPPHRP